jgi:hypothetical protein
MRRVSCVFFVLLLLSGPPVPLAAQQGERAESGEQATGFQLQQNYPNPFNPETRIPFVLEESLFEDGRTAIVSIRIFNVLQQLVASPTALNHPRGPAAEVIDLEYTHPGRFEAYWDGRSRSGDPVASGVYFLQLQVNGRTQIRKMFVTK